jgi:hypothetical protein
MMTHTPKMFQVQSITALNTTDIRRSEGSVEVVIRLRLDDRGIGVLFRVRERGSYIVTWRLKAGTVEPEETSINRQRVGKHVIATTNSQTTKEELLQSGVFCWVHSEAIWRRPQASWEDNMLYVWSDMYIWRKDKHIPKRQNHLLVREDVT